MCETEAGCPVEDLATDPVLEELVSRFVKLRGLFEMSKSETVYKQLMSDFGFDADSDFHFAAESTYLRWLNKTREKASSMSSTIRTTKRR
jgi:hypothetical protein